MSSQYYSATAYVGTPHRNEVEVTIPLVGPAGPQGPAGEGGGGDLTSPGPIGSVAPNTAAFTTLSATGTATLPHIHGSLAGNLYIHVKNTSGGQLTRGTPVYIVGNVGDTDRVEVAAADFDDATKMPAVGLLEQTLANNGTGDAVIVGELTSANTGSYSLNQELFVGNNGALTTTRPNSGEVQSVGTVSRVHASTGVIVVNMQGRRSPNETFAQASHTHAAADITDLNAAAAGALYDGALSIAGAVVSDAELRLINGDANEVVLAYENITATRFITLPDASGTLALNPLTTAGDIVVGGTSGAPARLALGTASQQLRVNSGATALEYFTPAAAFDPASPGAIGNTTPAAGNFTTLTANNGTLAASAPALNIEQTWNGAGVNFIAAQINAIRASGSSSSADAELLRLSENGTEVFRFRRTGQIVASTITLTSTTGSTINSGNGNFILGSAASGVYLNNDATNHTLAIRNGTNAQEFRLYGTHTSTTNFQRLTIKTKAVTLSALSGASVATTTGFIPDGAVLVGLTTRVSTAITGATGYDIGDGSDADRWGANIGIALNTSSDNTNWTATTIQCFTAAQEVTLTAVGSNFTGGVVVIVAHYLAGEAD